MRQVLLISSLLFACADAGSGSPGHDARALQALESQRPLQIAKVTVLSATGRVGTMGARREEAIYTDLTLRIDAPIRGTSGDTLTVTTLGGQVGDRAMHVSGRVELRASDEAIVWVDPSSLRPFVEVLRVRDGRVYSASGHPLVAVRDSGLVLGGREQPAHPAPVPLGTASGSLETPQPGVAMSVADAVEALRK